MKELKFTMKVSLEFMIMWFSANYFYNAGLASTSVSSSTVLCNTSSIFVYIAGLCLLDGVNFDCVKALMVIFSFTGIVIVTLADNDGDEESRNDSLKGDVLSLLSAMFYGAYAVTLKKRIPPEKEENFKFSYFLGFVGLFNVVFLMPLFPILNYTGIEPFEWPN